jgi:hypothetical protein
LATGGTGGHIYPAVAITTVGFTLFRFTLSGFTMVASPPPASRAYPT